MIGKQALITGANKGIGLATARWLSRKGFAIWLGARDDLKGAEAAELLRSEGVDVRHLLLDVTDQVTLEAAVTRLEDEAGTLDALINNAGILAARTLPSETSSAALRAVFEVNFFGAIAVTQAMLPLLRRAPAARIVNVSSGIGSLTQSSDPDYEFYRVKSLSYAASKAALNMSTVQFAYELRDTGIKVNSADPGHTATGLNGYSGRRSPEQAADVIGRLATLGSDGPTGQFFDEAGALPW